MRVVVTPYMGRIRNDWLPGLLAALVALAGRAAERRQPRGLGTTLPLRYPRRDQRVIGTGLAAQLRGALGQRLVEFTRGGSLEDPGHLGEQVTPAAGPCAELGDRGGFLLCGKRAPPGVMPRFAGQLSHQNPVGTRSGMILTHLSRVEYDYGKGKVNSRNELYVIRRVLTARPAGSGGARFMMVPGMPGVIGRAARETASQGVVCDDAACRASASRSAAFMPGHPHTASRH